VALKADPAAQATLLDLQAIDTRLAQLAHRAKTLPQRAALATLDAEAESLRARRVEQTGLLEDARAELGRVESDVALVETRMARDRARLQSSSSVKDVAGLESELVGLRRRLGDLEDVQLSVMERVEEFETASAAATAEAADLERRTSDVRTERDAAMSEIDAGRTAASADRAALVGGLPAELVALYERQRARYGFGASLLRGGVSSASGVRLLENELAVVRAAAPDDVLICPDSQAVLVRTAESGL